MQYQSVRLPLSKYIWVAVFSLALMPIYFSGKSVNYLFVIIPIFILLSGRSLYFPKPDLIVFFVLAFTVFLFSFLSEPTQFPLRRFGSFAIFCSILTFSFVPLSGKIINYFVYSVGLVASYYSINSIMGLIKVGDLTNIMALKGLLGDQRTAVVTIIGFSIFFYRMLKFRLGYFDILFFIISSVGVMLTFSRAAFLAATFAACYAVFVTFSRRLLLKGMILPVIVVVFMLWSMDFLLVFYEKFLFEKVLSGDFVKNFFEHPGSSEGARLVFWENNLNYLLQNPLLGSGYLGTWILYDDLQGSSHSDYFDRALRLGIPLFTFYMYLLCRVGLYLHRHHQDFFAGYFACIVFGFFHEAFAISTGAVFLSMCLALYSQSFWRRD